MSHHREHKVKHSFQDSLNPICSCGENIDTSAYFLYYYPSYLIERSTFIGIIRNIDGNILQKTIWNLLKPVSIVIAVQTESKALILNATIDFRRIDKQKLS